MKLNTQITTIVTPKKSITRTLETEGDLNRVHTDYLNRQTIIHIGENASIFVNPAEADILIAALQDSNNRLVDDPMGSES